MKHLPTVFSVLFLGFCFFFNGYAQAQVYDEKEKNELYTFLLQGSAEAGKLNYTMLGITEEELSSGEWVKNATFTWNDDNPKRLIALECSNKGVGGDLSLTSCTFLELLDCPYNSLESIDVSRLAYLRNLRCQNNQITKLNVAACYGLTDLNCSLNRIGRLELSNLRSLKTASCTSAELGLLFVNGCTELVSLECSHNRLTNLSLSSCSLLETLFCNNNQLKTLSLKNNPFLEYVDCTFNEIQVLDVNSDHLRVLLCPYNELTSLDVSDCASLGILYCANNKLNNLNVAGLNELYKLRCEENSLTSLNVSGCSSLTELNCSLNRLSNLNTSGCEALTYFYCRDNNLTTVDVSEMVALKDFNCRNNQLEELDIYSCEELTYLNVYSNGLKQLKASEEGEWEYFNCGMNKLQFSTLPVAPLFLEEAYVYSPQSKNVLSAPYYRIDLSSEIEVENVASAFRFFYTKEDINAIKIDEGVFSVPIEYIGRTIFCDVSNELFKDLLLSYQISVTKDDTSLEEVEAADSADLTIYPVPARSGEVLSILTEQSGQRLELWSLLGVLIHSQEIKEEIVRINAPESSGVYLIRIVDKDRIRERKIIVD